MSGQVSSAAAASADKPASRGLADRDFLVVFAFIALAVADLVLVITTSPGVNYGGADGKAAQAEILATLEFARPFSITNVNLLQGLGSQMMPMNVWVNPLYWPFALFDKELASEISGIIAFICYATACYAMARCFDVPRVPSIIAAQLSIMLFAPAVRVLAFMLNFASIPGLVVVYAPHLLAFGLLARLSPRSQLPSRPPSYFAGYVAADVGSAEQGVVRQIALAIVEAEVDDIGARAQSVRRSCWKCWIGQASKESPCACEK